MMQEVLSDRQLLIEARGLEDDANLPANGLVGDLDSCDPGLAGGGPERGREDLKEGGFSSTVGADDAEYLAGPN